MLEKNGDKPVAKQSQIDHPPLGRASKRAARALTNEPGKVGEAYDRTAPSHGHIAGEFILSENTAKIHLQSAYSKTGVRSKQKLTYIEPKSGWSNAKSMALSL